MVNRDKAARRDRGARRCRGLALVLFLGCGSAPAAASAGDVLVEVGNVSAATGEIRVALCPRESFLTTDCPRTAHVPAAAGTTRVLFHDVAPGTYAVQVFQDLNGNGTLDRNILGIPTEPIGFSNDPKLSFGPPDFDAAAVAIPAQPVTVRVTLITG